MNVTELISVIAATIEFIKNDNRCEQLHKKSVVTLLNRNGITIESGEGATLGNCYHSNSYHILSNEKLPNELIVAMRDVGLLGYGQEYKIGLPVCRAENSYDVTVVNYVDSSD